MTRQTLPPLCSVSRTINPDEVIYVVDKRQELHFIQVFRCAKKTGIVGEDNEIDVPWVRNHERGRMESLSRREEGGVMRLENLIREIDEEMYKKIMDNRTVEETEAKQTAETVGLAAIKYGDLSNQASKDYIFDVDRFTSFEGNTGPYILYTIVRIKSILNKYQENGGSLEGLKILPAVDVYEEGADAPGAEVQRRDRHSIRGDLHSAQGSVRTSMSLPMSSISSNHETKILSEEEETKKSGYIAPACPGEARAGDVY